MYMVIFLEAYSALLQEWNTAQLCPAQVWENKLGLSSDFSNAKKFLGFTLAISQREEVSDL